MCELLSFLRVECSRTNAKDIEFHTWVKDIQISYFSWMEELVSPKIIKKYNKKTIAWNWIL